MLFIFCILSDFISHIYLGVLQIHFLTIVQVSVDSTDPTSLSMFKFQWILPIKFHPILLKLISHLFH